MRVEDGNRAEAVAYQAGKSLESQRTARPGGADASTAPEGAPAAGGDHLDLSGAAGRIRDVLASLAAGHAARVDQVASEVQAGRYRVDAQALSRAMLADSLGSAE